MSILGIRQHVHVVRECAENHGLEHWIYFYRRMISLFGNWANIKWEMYEGLSKIILWYMFIHFFNAIILKIDFYPNPKNFLGCCCYYFCHQSCCCSWYWCCWYCHCCFQHLFVCLVSVLDSKASNLSNMSSKYKKDAKYLNLRSSYAKIAAIVAVIVVFLLFIRFWILWGAWWPDFPIHQ